MAPIQDSPRPTRLQHTLSRFSAWALGLGGLIALSGGPCPCCGQQACPTGAVGIGVFAAALALGAQVWKRFTRS